MNRSAAALLVFVLTVAGSAIAESNVGDPEARFQRLAQELKLTDQQKLKVLLRMQVEDHKVHAIAADAVLSDQAKEARIASVQRRTAEEIRGILTPAQQVRFAELNAATTSAESHGPDR